MIPDYPGMNISSARTLMSSPKFGDSECVKARDILVMAGDLGLPSDNGVHVISVACRECDGSGQCECGNHCRYCGGKGTRSERMKIGTMDEMTIFSMWQILQREKGATQ